MKKLVLYFILIVLVVFSSCSTNYYEKSYEIKEKKWSSDEIFQFNVEISDNSKPYNMYINIKNSTDYFHSNVFLFVNVMYPDNTVYRDTVEGELADYRGQWLGKGNSNYKTNKFLYKRNVFFPSTGTYVFAIQHAMRDEFLSGILNIGLEVEKIKN